MRRLGRARKRVSRFCGGPVYLSTVRHEAGDFGLVYSRLILQQAGAPVHLYCGNSFGSIGAGSREDPPDAPQTRQRHPPQDHPDFSAAGRVSATRCATDAVINRNAAQRDENQSRWPQDLSPA
jgi:hypothetical protein